MPRQFQSEAELESQFMKRLNALGYKTVRLRDEDAVMAHFRTVLNQRNSENLKGKQLTDTEFKRVLNEMVGSKSLYEIGQLLRGSDVQPNGKIVITRDDNSDVYLDFFDGIHVDNNIFEVTHQVTVNAKYTNRYDVTILINGLPVVQVELKRRGVEFTQAFNQIIRYRDESFRRLYRYVQLFVVSNGDETRYFANGDGKLNSNFMFYWTDKQNKWLNDIDAFTASFFERARLHSLIAEYTIFDDDHNRMLIMRPYQVYATEAIIAQAENHPEKNGYIWHTTGSGKTITAFKASQLISHRTDAKKVIFLIDRSDLDLQTAKNFNSYLPKSVSNEPALDRTTSTKALVAQLKSSTTPLIITTIQKLSYAIKTERYKSVLTPFQDQHVVFIEDEAHRTQFGEMRKDINRWFRNAQHFGFTGTPIFPENVGADGRTTETLYNECLHYYLIKDAIRDKNVLGFSIQYINTIKGKDVYHDDQGDEMVSAIDKKEVMEAPDRLDMIAQHILFNHDQITHHRRYNAIFTVPSTEMALNYYDTFKRLDKNHHFNIATIFTWAANEDSNEKNQTGNESPENETDALTSRHGLDKAIADYNKQFGTNFSTDDFKAYFDDVSKRMKQHNDQTKDSNIDILIVVNMFLTGFDSPKLSTLYVDKKLQWHNLLQAFSRTNRIEEDSKPFGNIVAYRNIKQFTDDAVKLFSQGSSSVLFVPPFEELQKQFNEATKGLHEVVATPQDVDVLYNEGDEAVKKFVLAFRGVLRVYNKIRVYDDFDWSKVENFSEDDLHSYQGLYFNAYHNLKKNQEKGPTGSVLEDVDFDIELFAHDVIDVQYIVNLIRTINLENDENRKNDTNKIKKLLGDAASDDLKLKSELLAQFLDEVIPQLRPGDNITSELNKFLAQKREEAIVDFSNEIKLPEDAVQHQIDNVDFYGQTDSKELTTELNKAGYKFGEKITLKKRVTNFVKNTLKKFVLS